MECQLLYPLVRVVTEGGGARVVVLIIRGGVTHPK